jgi:hypothetical protein
MVRILELLEDLEDSTRIRLCCKFWRLGKRGDKTVYRPEGCGNINLCPTCGDYYHRRISNYQSELWVEILRALQDLQVDYRGAGLALEFTIPEALSRELDRTLSQDPEKAKLVINKLFRTSWKIVSAFLPAIRDPVTEGSSSCVSPPFSPSSRLKLGAIGALHYWKSGSPWEPHFHIHYTVLPVGLEEERILPLQIYQTKELLERIRSKWRKALEKIFKVEIPEAVIHFRYIRKNKLPSLFNRIEYNTRPIVEDLLKRVRIRNGKLIGYKRLSRRNSGVYIELAQEQVQTLLERVRSMSSIKKIRWLGILSSSSRGNFLRILSIEKRPIPDKFTDLGVRLIRLRETSEGLILQKFERRIPGSSWEYELLTAEEQGDPFLVTWEDLDLRPLGVSGPRASWRRAPPGGNGQEIEV